MARGPDISLDIFDKRFSPEARPLFQDFHLKIVPETVVALVGPSGVGKSSLLRMIAGIDTNFSGKITVGGVAAEDTPPAGFVLQDARLLPWLTAIDNIRAVAPKIADAEAMALLGRVGLRGSENAYPHQLSGGMQRRVAIARAFSVNSSLLLLDEPFVSLDRHLVSELQNLFLDLIDVEKPTVILVTHLAEDAARLADRAVVLDGRPAGIVADLHFDKPRGERSPAERLELAERIAAHSAGVIA
ncbi:MAG TPA: ATP-binding cassette domain-containing protein [Devosiaceae bacterium]|jgi:NitT/TauT family transport system ATP-binding protein/sulfonate transport system ATP-binding protein